MNPAKRRHIWIPSFIAHPWVYALSGAVAGIFLCADILLPRGATVAIGYCLVPVILAGTRKRNALFAGSLICVALTWIGYFLEPGGVPAWSSIFDRAMVSGILCLAGVLMWRRLLLVETLTHQTHELQRSNTELEGFAYVVAHDIRSPMQSISLLIDIISRSQPCQSDAIVDTSITTMRSELTRLSMLIERLLTYGRAESAEIIRADCNCDSILAEVRQALQSQIQQSGATITSDPLPVIHADPYFIAELLQNLIENSIKYAGDHAPEIHLSATEDSDGWTFYVRDNGVGIPPQSAAAIFEPFHRIQRLKSHRKGVGLGLATCKRIVERHGGRIEVRSLPAQGSTFIFSIPRIKRPSGVDSDLAHAHPLGKGFWEILDDALVVPREMVHR